MQKLKIVGSIALLVASVNLEAYEPFATAVITVDESKAVGPIRCMNAVNNGPYVGAVAGDQKRGNFVEYKAARIPYARLHDSINCVSGGAHSVDVSAIFPDFDADENDPKNYDFIFTDHYLDEIRRAGTEVYYRLGQTIEHGPKKYGALPPKDFAKWARICEHIIRHYNEGWGWGVDTAQTTSTNVTYHNQFQIKYWEIWNEPDLDQWQEQRNGLPTAPRCWGGSVTNFYELYTTAAKHLKAKFPDLKIGGPALCGDMGKWTDNFLKYLRDHDAPLDFFSWHIYATEPGTIAERCSEARRVLDRNGYHDTPSILNEWNYVKGWSDDWVYSLECESGRFNQKGAAFIAATMIDCQHRPLDMLMFYDARVGTTMNNLFDIVTLQPKRGYYPFLAWAKLVDCGTEVATTLKEGRGSRTSATTGVVLEKNKSGAASGQFRCVAAKGKDGEKAIFIARYSDDNNTTDTAKVWVVAPGADFAKARCHLTDAVRINTEVPLEVEPDGSAVIRMQPNSFATVEWQ